MTGEQLTLSQIVDNKLREIRLIIIAGVRPQFIKLAALQRGIEKWNAQSDTRFNAVYVNAGQHDGDELSGKIIEELSVSFDYEFVYNDLNPLSVFAKMIVNLVDLFARLRKTNKTDWVVVLGDANTTMAAAIAASRVFLPLIHIEAGIRTGEQSPEEVNRFVVDRISTANFVACKRDIQTLALNGILEKVYWTGDILYDSVLEYSPKLPSGYDSYATGEYILATIHREENLGSGQTLGNLVTSLDAHGRKVLFFLHPRTRAKLLELDIGETQNIEFLSPLTYRQMLSALKGCAFVLTDSGGLQREAYYLHKRALVRQDKPFWDLLTSIGFHKTIGASAKSIEEGLDWIESNLDSSGYPATDQFGSGHAVHTTLEAIYHLSSVSKAG